MKQRWHGAALIGAMIVITLGMWAWLPERIPSHWNVRGEVDGWAPRFPGALFAPGVALALWLVMPVLRRVDPRRANFERFDETFTTLINVMVLYFVVIQGVVLASSLGVAVDVTRVMLAMIGVTFIVIGNLLPRLRSNWWLGIRTPWTLESERIWRDTHRLGGWTFVGGGAVALAAMLLPVGLRFPVAITALVGGSLIPVVWSWVLWRRHGPEGTQV